LRKDPALAVENLFAGTNIADARQQFFPVSPAARLIQQPVIHGNPFNDVFLQRLGYPNAKLRAAQGFYAISCNW